MGTTNYILLVLCFVTACVSCYFVGKQLKTEYTESRAFCLGFLAFYALLFLYGIIAHMAGFDGFDQMLPQKNHAVTQDDALAYDDYMVFATLGSICFLIYNIIICFIAKRGKNVLLWVIGLFIAGLVLLSIITIPFLGTNPLINFFGLCCGVMAYFAWVLELTYKQFCVLGNIYVQDIMVLLFALAPLALFVRKYQPEQKLSWLRNLVAVNAAIHVIATLIVAIHYWMPIEASYDMCYHELQWLGSATGLGYIGANMITFVIPFILDLIWNTQLYRITKKKLQA